VPRGWLEFKADPETPYFDERFDPDKPYVVQRAAGRRSALTARLKEMGYRDVRNLEGGFGAWEKAGLPVERG
jgi:rhodanese-related sulfurtransferase